MDIDADGKWDPYNLLNWDSKVEQFLNFLKHEFRWYERGFDFNNRQHVKLFLDAFWEAFTFDLGVRLVSPESQTFKETFDEFFDNWYEENEEAIRYRIPLDYFILNWPGEDPVYFFKTHLQAHEDRKLYIQPANDSGLDLDPYTDEDLILIFSQVAGIIATKIFIKAPGVITSLAKVMNWVENVLMGAEPITFENVLKIFDHEPKSEWVGDH